MLWLFADNILGCQVMQENFIIETFVKYLLYFDEEWIWDSNKWAISKVLTTIKNN